MPEDNVEHNWKHQDKLDKAKEVIKNNWKPFTVGVVFTGVTLLVTKRVVTPRFMLVEGANAVIHKAVLKDNSALYKVFNIYNIGFKNKGPSWIVKCVETGRVFASQKHAAKVMGLSKDHISNHLNGLRDHVSGYHFVRLGIAA